MSSRLEILLVEDNEGDIDLVLEVFKEADVKGQVTVARDGVEALATLRARVSTRGAHIPDLVLLDLNLPKMDGREVLRAMRADVDLKYIPVVVLTSSEAERDLREVYALHANCLVTKPVDFDAFSTVLKSVMQFWFNVAKLPSRQSAA